MTQDNHSRYLCFDPRDPAQRIQDRATWKRSDNGILIASTMLFASQGDKIPIDWDKVSALATLCENISDDVLDIPPAVDTPLRQPATLDETNMMLCAVLASASRANRNGRPTPTAP